MAPKRYLDTPDIVLNITQLLRICLTRKIISRWQTNLERYPGPPEWWEYRSEPQLLVSDRHALAAQDKKSYADGTGQ
jgi:hypothetical protein